MTGACARRAGRLGALVDALLDCSSSPVKCRARHLCSLARSETWFGSCPQDAPYLLEPLVANFGAEPVPVRLALLAAVGKLFFARPPECQRLLGALLAAGCADSNQDVHDRALMYYRCESP